MRVILIYIILDLSVVKRLKIFQFENTTVQTPILKQENCGKGSYILKWIARTMVSPKVCTKFGENQIEIAATIVLTTFSTE